MVKFDFDRLYRYADLDTTLRALAAAHPRFIEYGVLGHSHEGRAIPVLTVTDRHSGAAVHKPALWVDGNIHAMEVSASSACLYFVAWLVQRLSTDPQVQHCLRTRTFYVCPRLNPDGVEWALSAAPRFVRASTRAYPWPEDSVAGLMLQDIDEDGRVMQMRLPDARGAWKAHPEEPRLLVRRDPADTHGQFYRLMGEGVIRDFDGRGIRLVGATGSAATIDLNRNFPARWNAAHSARGSGPYPGSEPETRAVMDFVSTHPNICVGTSFHTFGGMLLRPFAEREDSAMAAEDLLAFKVQGEHGQAMTGYPAGSVYDLFHEPGTTPIGGTFDAWLYEHRGCLAWTVEMWNPRRCAGVSDRPWTSWFRHHPEGDDLALFRWSERELGGAGYGEWRAFDHPQLGRVEIGGWNKMAAFSNPPAHCLEEEVARYPQWLLWLALGTPLIELRALQADRVDRATWRVRAVIGNAGWLPTNVTKVAVANGVTRGVVATLLVGRDQQLIAGRQSQALGELQGWSNVAPGITFWPMCHPTQDEGYAEWVVRSEARASIAVEAAHERAGRSCLELTLDPDGSAQVVVTGLTH